MRPAFPSYSPTHTDALPAVLDEADRILDMGFSASLNAIIANLPRSRQTLLFSATQTKSVKDLARLSLKDPEYVAVREGGAKGKEKAEDGEEGDEEVNEVPSNLEQHYMVVDLPTKLDMLWSFIKTHLFTKTIVFLSSGKQVRLFQPLSPSPLSHLFRVQVRFVYENFRHMRPGVPLMHMHGKQKQMQRLEIYQRFLSSKHAILFATDVAARGLDFPAVDWVVQLDAPEDVDTYIHRVGRTARYQAKGKALLFLLPSEEEGMVKRLEAKKMEVNKIKANDKKKQSIRSQLQSAAFQYPEIKFLAQRVRLPLLSSLFSRSPSFSCRHSSPTSARSTSKKTRPSSSSTTSLSKSTPLPSVLPERRRSSLERRRRRAMRRTGLGRLRISRRSWRRRRAMRTRAGVGVRRRVEVRRTRVRRRKGLSLDLRRRSRTRCVFFFVLFLSLD